MVDLASIVQLRIVQPSTRTEGQIMKYPIPLTISAAVLLLSLGNPASAQGTPQTLSMTKTDPSTLATGYRASRVVGAVVVNEANETVGKIDDLIVTPTETVPYAVLSVGGFLGMDTKYVVVPFSAITVVDKHMMLRGATKASLKALPSFVYAP